MRKLGTVIADLKRYKSIWAKLPQGTTLSYEARAFEAARLKETRSFGSNPGALRMFSYMPPALEDGAPLVVVLHGCKQTAASYDYGAGWSQLADRYGFALVLPQQQPSNNPNSCFNWFSPADARRGQGEALSIRQMVEKAIIDHRVDRRRVFVTGLSAGGAMTSVMLATYPDVFAGGGIIAGLPYGAADTVQDAFGAMFRSPSRPQRVWGDRVRAASPHRGPWPRVSIWHGAADTTVIPQNAGEIVKQWIDVHGLSPVATERTSAQGFPKSVWRDAAGNAVIESYTIAGMAHGTPLAVGDKEGDVGVAGAFLLDVGISSSFHIAKFWGIAGAGLRQDSVRAGATTKSPAIEIVKERADAPAPSVSPAHATDVGRIIRNALQAAGLMKAGDPG